MHERDPLLSEQLEALRDVYDKVIGKYNFIETTELYRYTTSSGLKRIIEHKEIWATDIRFFSMIEYSLSTIGRIMASKVYHDYPSTRLIVE